MRSSLRPNSLSGARPGSRAAPRALRAALVAVGLAAGCEPPVATPAPAPATSVALFDPLATPPVVPTPNDLAFQGGDGTHLNIPDQPGDSPAQRAFNGYLRQLDGFPASSTAMAMFSTALAPASVTVQSTTMPGSIIVVDTTSGMLLGPDAITATLSSDGKTLSLAPTMPFAAGHRFAVLVFGYGDPAGLRGAMGELVIASPAFYFLRSPVPLVARCRDPGNPACACPADALANPADTSCHSIILGLSDAAARQAEPQREQLQAALAMLLPLVAPGRSESDLALFWTFTITTQPMTVFDPASGNVPFPNDVLIDPTTGLVNLPIAMNDPQAPLKKELNTLDGFSVSAPETIGVSGPAPIDAATVVAGRTVLLVNLDPTPGAPQPEYTAAPTTGMIAIEPTMPLVSDQARYGAIVTSGVNDTSGRALLPPPALFLALGPDPLFDGTRSTVNVLSDAQAMQLEMLRVALQPLVATLEGQGLSRTLLAGLWTFTTQSIVRPNAALAAYPAGASLSTDVTITKMMTQAELATAGLPFPTSHLGELVLGTFTSRALVDATTGTVPFTRAGSTFTVTPPASAHAITIRFWLALPPPSVTPAPIAIVQHGLTSWRGDVIPLADGLAQAGWASFGFDLDFHGARSRCNADNQCIGGAAGSCNVATGQCASGFVPTPTSQDPLACSIAAVSGDPTDCRPLISGQGYLDPTNLFSGKGNGEQYIVDASQVVHLLGDSGNTRGLGAQLAAAAVTPGIDAARLGLLGQSLGAIDGAVFLSASKAPRVGVLNVGGGHLFEIIADGAFHSVVDQYLMSIGVMRGTPQYAQLVATARWILDPVDPFSVAPGLRDRPIIVEEAGADMVIPPIYEEDLAHAIFGPAGLDEMHHARGRQNDGTFVSTYFAGASHGALLGTEATSASMRAQAITYLTTLGALLPAP